MEVDVSSTEHAGAPCHPLQQPWLCHSFLACSESEREAVSLHRDTWRILPVASIRSGDQRAAALSCTLSSGLTLPRFLLYCAAGRQYLTARTGPNSGPRKVTSERGSSHRVQSTEGTPSNRPSAPARLVVASAIGCTIAAYVRWRMYAKPHLLAKDFTTPWRAARALVDGQNPYDVIQRVGTFPFDERFLYPLPAAIATLPFEGLNVYAAGALFIGLSSAFLAFAVTRDAWWRLLIFLSPCYFIAVWSIQVSPLIAAVALTPALGFLALYKPNIGLVALLYRPRATAFAGCVAFGVLSIAVMPDWPARWLVGVRAPLFPHTPPILWPFGFVALIAAARWRTREARTVLAMACIPTAMWYYDHLLLWLVPRTPRQSLFLTACGWVSLFALFAANGIIFSQEGLARMAPYQTLGVYLPAALVALRHRNSHVDP
jgi:hypothetical protein